MRILLIVLFGIVTFSGNAQNDSTSTDRIYWSEWYQLEWEDFYAEPLENEKVAALSSIGLPYSYSTDGEGSIIIKINVCFIKNESWSKVERQNNVLLQHEQLHFDIAELHRRKIVKRLLELEFTKEIYRELLDQAIEQLWSNAYRSMQDKYDEETNFSRIFKEQINWNKFVSQELRNFEDFTFTEVEVSLINFD
jgi:hypothetical protein